MKYLGEVLPNNMIPLAIANGQKLLEESTIKNVRMVNSFRKQIGRTNCGPASLALIISSIHAAFRLKLSDPLISDKDEKALMQKLDDGEELLITENDIINHGNTKDYIQEINVAKNGMTVLELEHVTSLLGFGVNTYFAYNDQLNMDEEKRKDFKKLVSENSNRFVFKDHEDFSDFVCNHITRPNTGILLNYHMAKLGYLTNFGHHSPVAAFANDSLLVMDVWPDTQPAWVNTKLMYESMYSIDNANEMPRGLLHIYELM